LQSKTGQLSNRWEQIAMKTIGILIDKDPSLHRSSAAADERCRLNQQQFADLELTFCFNII
jgi:hypothetical protein